MSTSPRSAPISLGSTPSFAHTRWGRCIGGGSAKWRGAAPHTETQGDTDTGHRRKTNRHTHVIRNRDQARTFERSATRPGVSEGMHRGSSTARRRRRCCWRGMTRMQRSRCGGGNAPIQAVHTRGAAHTVGARPQTVTPHPASRTRSTGAGAGTRAATAATAATTCPNAKGHTRRGVAPVPPLKHTSVRCQHDRGNTRGSHGCGAATGRACGSQVRNRSWGRHCGGGRGTQAQLPPCVVPPAPHLALVGAHHRVVCACSDCHHDVAPQVPFDALWNRSGGAPCTAEAKLTVGVSSPCHHRPLGCNGQGMGVTSSDAKHSAQQRWQRYVNGRDTVPSFSRAEASIVGVSPTTNSAILGMCTHCIGSNRHTQPHTSEWLHSSQPGPPAALPHTANATRVWCKPMDADSTCTSSGRSTSLGTA